MLSPFFGIDSKSAAHEVVAVMSFLSSFVTPYVEDRRGLLISSLLACAMAEMKRLQDIYIYIMII